MCPSMRLGTADLAVGLEHIANVPTTLWALPLRSRASPGVVVFLADHLASREMSSCQDSAP